VERTFEYRSDLRQTTLPEILFTIHHHRVPGLMEATREGVTKRVWVRSGAVICATSTDRNDSLGAFLRRQNIITPEIYGATVKARAMTGRRFGSLLVEGGHMSPGEVYRGIAGQIEEIVWSLFTWEEGDINFRISEFEDQDMVRIHLPLRHVIVEGIKRAPSARALAQRIGRKETIFEPSFRVEELIEIGLGADDWKLLSLVNGKRSFFELCNAGPWTPAENAKVLYAFLVLQIIRRSGIEQGGIKIRLRTEGDEFSGT
jgi:uncharacterized protein DUF4388